MFLLRSVMLAVVFAAIAAAKAQVGPIPGMGPLPLPNKASTTYLGPGDVVGGAVAWWGLRGYSAAYSTGSNNAATIRRASDNATANILILNNGAFDVTTATSFCATTTCYITKLYDQSSGLYSLSQSTAASQPQLNLSCSGGPAPVCITFSGSQVLLSSTYGGLSQPFTYSSVVNNSTSGTREWAGGNGCGNYFINATIELYCGIATTVVITYGNWNSFVVVANGSSSTYDLNGSITTHNIGTNGLTSGYALSMGANYLSAQNFIGNVEEVGLWSGAFNSTQYDNMTTNNRNYWGF